MSTSLCRWFSKSGSSNKPYLPDPSKEESVKKQEEVSKANERVVAAMEPTDKKRRYNFYSPELRAKIGKCAAESENQAAVRKLSAELGKPISESKVRGIKKAYYKALREKRNPEPVNVLKHGLRGRPLKLGSLDPVVQNYIRKLRLAGGIVNRSIVIAAATGIVEHNNPALLTNHGGTIELTKKWADSILLRMNLVKRKATKAARKVPPDFPEIKLAFLNRIACCVKEYNIPPSLILNWDQTGTKFVPTSDWTLAAEGSRQVAVVGLEDKREMTVLLTCTMSGLLLPPQLLYAGKTSRCYPAVTFPAEWDVYHSESHWSTEDTMLHYIDNILVPYVQATRRMLGLPDTQCALAIFDVFASHRCDKVLDALERNHIKCCYVPANCTGELQPLDITVNQVFKKELKGCFTKWYAGIVKQELDKGVELSTIKPDLRISTLKPIHAKWLMQVLLNAIPTDAIVSGFEKSGIKESIVY